MWVTNLGFSLDLSFMGQAELSYRPTKLAMGRERVNRSPTLPAPLLQCQIPYHVVLNMMENTSNHKVKEESEHVPNPK